MDAGCWQVLAQQVILQCVSTTLGLNKHQGQTLQDKQQQHQRQPTTVSARHPPHHKPTADRVCWCLSAGLDGSCSLLAASYCCRLQRLQLPMRGCCKCYKCSKCSLHSCYSRQPSSRSQAQSRASGPAARTQRAGQSGLWSYPHDRLSGKCSRAGSLQATGCSSTAQSAPMLPTFQSCCYNSMHCACACC